MSKGLFCPLNMHLAFVPTGNGSGSSASVSMSSSLMEPPMAASAAMASAISTSSSPSLVRISQISTFESLCQPASSVLTANMLCGDTGHHVARHGAVLCTNTASGSNVGSAHRLLRWQPEGDVEDDDDGAAPSLQESPALVPYRTLKMTVRKSREQLASLVPHGEKTTYSTSSVCSVSRHSSLFGALLTLFSNSCFQVGNRI
mmetsp:Transcript_63307/g.151009  ORF Transcript_63307/g.151009 Transcript_63307/m.151009 type:complete len:202 (-) Transcript_63307:694-1299(-)